MNIFLWMCFKINNALSLGNVKGSLLCKAVGGRPDQVVQSISHSNTQTDKHETESSHEYRLNHAGQHSSNKNYEI